jgi:prepilin-type N-terminal cleavage/methylation domain-containing protein
MLNINYKPMNKKGFTLIELLVVIAIIGILSSVAIVYLQDARNKANDAKVQSNIATASTQTEIARANGESVDSDTYRDSVIAKLGTYPCTAAGKVSWTASASTTASVVAYYAQLCTSDSYFCADTNGFRGLNTAVPAVDGQCNAN